MERPGHRNLEDNSLQDAQTPGCKSFEEKETADGKEQMEPVATDTPRTLRRGRKAFRNGTDTMEREGLETMERTKGHSDCRAGREEKSKLETERSRDMAEKTGKVENGTGMGMKGQERACVTTFLDPGTWMMSLVNSEI